MNEIGIFGIEAFSERYPGLYFYANDLKTHLKSHRFINVPHRHSTYIVVFFTSGSGTHSIDFENYEVKPGAVFMLKPGQVHCWQLAEETNGFIFFHTAEFYSQVFLKRKPEHYPFFYLEQNYPVIYLPETELDQMKLWFEKVNVEFGAKRGEWTHSLALLTDLIYIELSRPYAAFTPPDSIRQSGYDKVLLLQKLIDQHFTDVKLPGHYAEMMHLSTRHLSRLCRQFLGKPTQELISGRVMLEAKRLLVHGEMTMTAISEKLGFEDHSYFVRQFKKATGTTPKGFQKGVLG